MNDGNRGFSARRSMSGQGDVSYVACKPVSLRSGHRFRTHLRSVDASRIRDILKEEIGKLPPKVELVREDGR